MPEAKKSLKLVFSLEIWMYNFLHMLPFTGQGILENLSALTGFYYKISALYEYNNEYKIKNHNLLNIKSTD